MSNAAVSGNALAAARLMPSWLPPVTTELRTVSWPLAIALIPVPLFSKLTLSTTTPTSPAALATRRPVAPDWIRLSLMESFAAATGWKLTSTCPAPE